MKFLTRAFLAAVLLTPSAWPLHAQPTTPSNAVILAKIAALEAEIATLKAQLVLAAPQAGRAPTLGEAAAEAAKVKHDWGVSTNTGAPGQAIAPTVGLKGATGKDAAYWQDRMRPVRAKLEESEIAVEAQDRLVKTFRVGGLEWTKAINELKRLMDVRLNDMHHFSEAFDEAVKAGFTPEKYDGPSHKYKDK